MEILKPLYKAVRIVDNKRVSLTYRDLHASWIVTYPIDEWVEAPHGSGLFVEDRIIHYQGAEVWRVQVEELTYIATVVHIMLMTYPTALQSFWDRFYCRAAEGGHRKERTSISPCVVAKRVRLTERVWSDECACLECRALYGRRNMKSQSSG